MAGLLHPLFFVLLIPAGVVALGAVIQGLDSRRFDVSADGRPHRRRFERPSTTLAQANLTYGDHAHRPNHNKSDAAGPLASGQRMLFAQIQDSYELAETWLLANIRDKGLFRYLYDVEQDEYPNRNNELRQLMASRLLAELAAQRPELNDLHRHNLEFILRNWYRESGGLGYIEFDGKSKLGANAMALRTVAASPFADEYPVQAQALLSGILTLMNSNGSFRPWLKEPNYAYDADYLLTFYSGEVILALVEYHRATGDRPALAAAIRAQDYYLHKYVAEIDANYYPAYVPWHTQSLHGLFELTGDRRYADAALLLNDKVLELLDTTIYVGRFYNPETPQYGNPHSASDGVYTEGLAHAYAIALELGDDDRANQYLAALGMSVANLRSLQYQPQDAEPFGIQGPRLLGGIRISATNPDVRLDNVQHAMDAYRMLMMVLGE